MPILKPDIRIMAKLIIRAAEESDLDALVVMRVALQKHLESRDPEIWKFSQRAFDVAPLEIKSRLKNPNCFFGIAVTDTGQPVGIVMAEAVKDDYRIPSAFGHIHWLYVLEKARRRGIGLGLVKLACEYLSNFDIEQITVGYVARNPEADSFWKKLGFASRVIHASCSLEDMKKFF